MYWRMGKTFCTVYELFNFEHLIFERTIYHVKNFLGSVSEEAFLTDYQKPHGLIKLQK